MFWAQNMKNNQHNTGVRLSNSSVKRLSSETKPSLRTIPLSMVPVSSKTGLHQDILINTNSNRRSSSSTVNEKELRQEMYSKSSKSSVTSNIHSTKINEQSSGSLSQTLNSIIKSETQDIPNLEHDIRYTKLFLQKQGLQNISM